MNKVIYLINLLTMAKIIKTISQLGGQQVSNTFPVTVPVKSGTAASIKPGYLVRTDNGNAGYWKAGADADSTTLGINMGIATSESTETAGADGTVTIETAPVMLVAIKAKAPGSLTAAMKGLAYILDVTSGDYTLDQATSTNGIFNILDFDNTTDGNCICALTTHWRG
jgi:hypothetical protein